MGRYSHFLKYNLSGARGYSVMGKGLCIHRNIIIPKTHRGAAIVGIGENAFAGDTALTSVVIPEGVRFIERGAFRGCSSLVSVTLPSTVEHIGVGSFAYCASLAELKLPAAVEHLSDSVFEGCAALERVELGGCSLIERDVFKDSGILNRAAFDGGVATYDGWVLSCTEGLEQYNIGRNVKGIASGVFDTEKRVNKTPNPEYERYRQEVQEYEWNLVIGLVGHSGHESEQYLVEKLPVRVVYEGTLEEWKKVILPESKDGFPMTVTCSDGEMTVNI